MLTITSNDKPSNRTASRPTIEGLESRTLMTAAVPGFTQTAFGGAINHPTAMAFAPDGRLFVVQQDGIVRVIKDGVLLPTPFTKLSVQDVGERGMLGIAFDPNFAANHFVYLYRTVTFTGPQHAPHNIISRVTAGNGDVAIGGSCVNLFELDNLSSATNHNGGAIHFGADGKLYIGVGDNANGSNAQTLSNTLGKVLRINPDGTIPTDNPFYNQTTGRNRAIWALGLRNPFTFDVQRGTGKIFVNDVGLNTTEEIDVGVAGANYGWPGIEGPRAANQPKPAIGTYVDPIFSYPHGPNDSNGVAITGGAFYNPAVVQFPASYVGDYFYADLGVGYVRTINSANGAFVGTFATNLALPVDLKVGPDGALYALTIGGGDNAGQVYRFAYTGSTGPAT